MNQNFSELVKYLDEKFNRLENDIANLQKEVINTRGEIVDIKGLFFIVFHR